MDNEFEKIYDWTNEKIEKERKRVKEYKKDVRQSEGLLIGIILLCIIISFITDVMMAKYVFITVAGFMFIFCTFYSFKQERRIIDKQNEHSEFALAELATHIKDGFIYEEDEELSGSFYRKSGFNRIYKELISKGVITGTKQSHTISLSNIIVKSQTKELFRGIFLYGTLNNSIDEIDVMRVNSKNNKKEKYEIPGANLFIYAEDMRKARNVLTDEIIEKAINFKSEINLQFEMMINKNLIFFRFFDNDIITKPITNEKETKQYLYKYYRIIEFVADFINSIDK